MNTYNNLINNLESLELFRFKENIDTYLDLIAGGEKTALDALCELTESEIDFRKRQAITGCVKVANFPFLKEICEFDFSFQPSLDKSKIMDLLTLRFIEKAASENRLETRIKWFCRYKLLIIDELGYQKMDVDSANLFFNLIAKRYEKLSTVITTNSPFSKWSDIFQEPVLTNALLDRLLHHCSVININGPSYRLKDQMQYLIEEN